jgi:hypothetical protein
MQNLVKIQEDLKNLPLQAVMSYVNGRNPMVPPYLALTELNRRKQIQQSAQAQSAQPQATVKDQVQQQAGIMALQNQRAQQGMENMQQNAGRVPQPGAVPMNAPVQGMPAQAPTVQAAQGGLMNARMSPAMFNRQNFAGGGIVAFAGKEGSSVEDEGLTEEEKKALEDNKYLQRSRAVANFPSAVGDFLRKYNPVTGSAYSEGIEKIVNQSPADQAASFRKASMRPEQRANVNQEVPAVPTASQREVNANTAKDLAAFDAATALLEKERAAKVVPPVVTADAKTTTTAPVAPKVTTPATTAVKKDIYEQEIENLAKLKERFGVKEQPMSESDKMIADLRKRIDEQRGQQGIEAIAAAMAKGSKAKRASEAFAGFGEGYFEATGKQRALNNEQDQAFANLQVAREKEDDARRRGDVKAVQEAVKDKQKYEIDVKNAESNRIQAMKPSQFREQVDLYTRDPVLYGKMFPKENPLVVAAAKEYFEKEQLYKKDYPTVQDYIRAKGLSMSGDAPTASAPSAPPQAAIDALKKDPKLKKQFDDKYGPGASNRYLG